MIVRKAKIKAEREAQIKDEQFKQEMQQCTFQPDLIATRTIPQQSIEPIEIRGLDTYLANKQHAYHLQQEYNKREKKAFINGDGYLNGKVKKGNRLITIPQAFHVADKKSSFSKG